tara:strand:- start:1481 stop:2728 length:1248 start_codon:yes stop_codon:yes gene_type:complete
MDGSINFYGIFAILTISLLVKWFNIHIFALIIFTNFNLSILFPNNEQLFGIISIEQINLILLTLGLYFHVKKTSSNATFDKYKRISLLYLSISFVATLYAVTKSEFVIWETNDLYRIFRNTLTLTLTYTVLILLFNRINTKRIHKVLESSIIWYGIIFSLSTVFLTTYIKGDMEIGIRSGGLFEGDLNYFSGYLAIIFGYILAKYEADKILKPFYIICLLAIMFGIAKTGSRAGLIGLVLICLYFLIRNKNRRGLIIVGMLGVGYVLLIQTVGTLIFDRLLLRTPDLEVYQDDRLFGASSRISYWIIYIYDLFNNLEYFLIGNTKRSLLGRNVHNAFIGTLFTGGLFIFIPYIYSIIKMFRLPKSKLTGAFDPIYTLIPFVIMLMNVTEHYYLIIPVLIMMSYGYEEDLRIPETI